ncbi:MAG: hypothetical protein WC625_03975 [Caldisericia bacterium]|jgi:nitrogen regulatory protein PII|nr:hypothetical protein [Coprothermobacter sp.]
MYLLVIITRQEDKTYDFLKLLPTVGVRGATVIEGRGMGRILRDRETIFTSIEQILSASIDLTDNVVILSLVQGGEVLTSVRRLARQVFGDFARPNTGVLFVLPVADAEGLATGPDLTLPGTAHKDANV